MLLPEIRLSSSWGAPVRSMTAEKPPSPPPISSDSAIAILATSRERFPADAARECSRYDSKILLFAVLCTFLLSIATKFGNDTSTSHVATDSERRFIPSTIRLFAGSSFFLVFLRLS